MNDPLIGRCATCRERVDTLRRDAAPPRSALLSQGQREPGTFADQYSAACPKCGATVYLEPKQESKAADAVKVQRRALLRCKNDHPATESGLTSGDRLRLLGCPAGTVFVDMRSAGTELVCTIAHHALPESAEGAALPLVKPTWERGRFKGWRGTRDEG